MTAHKGTIFRFAEFEVHQGEFCLIRGGEAIPVEPKAFRVLLYLLDNPHRLVTKDELLDAVWQETSVSENSLTRSIAMLRRLLGDDTHEPRFIATVPTVGYRFLCDVGVTTNGMLWPESPQTAARTAESVIAANLETKNEHLAGSVKNRGSPLRFAGVGAALAAVVAIGFLLYRGMLHRSSHAAESNGANVWPSKMHISPLTSLPGLARSPALSPDGEKVAFFWNNETPAKWDLYVQFVGDAANPLRLTHTRSGFIDSANWSPDGRQIAFGRCDDNGGGVFVVPALGGPERKLTDIACTFSDVGYPQWTADGKSLVLADRCTPGAPRSIVLFSLATGEKKCLDTPPAADVGDEAPALSPDQKTIAFLRSNSADMAEIYTVAVSGGNFRQLTQDGGGMWRLMWSTDGRRIIFSSDRNGSNGVWQVPATGGPIQPEIEYPASGSLSRDGRRLAYEESSRFLGVSRSVWRAELAHPGGSVTKQARILATPGFSSGTQLSSDGRQIVFQSARSGDCEIWKSDADGSDPRQMTFFGKGYPGTPRWSPADKEIAFDYHGPTTHAQIYLVDSEGRNLHRITSGNYENVVPSWSRDGTSLYLSSNRTGEWQIWKHKLASGRDEQVTHHGGFAAFESYDGKTLYYSKFAGGGIWSVPVQGGQEQHLIEAPHLGDWGQFAVTQNGLYLVDSSTEPGPTILYSNFQNRKVAPVLMLKESVPPGTSNLASSRDGRTIIYTQVEYRGSILMAEKIH
jgi:Tol biopolymer transport system component/DNA-binding winged helix-turn-helix (wHTH) protein